MNLPIVPPIEFPPLADLRIERRARALATNLAGLAGLAGSGAMALRWVSPLVAIVRNARPKRRTRAPWLVAAGAGLVAAGFARWQLQRLFAPQTEHTLESSESGLELRHYAPTRVAETSVDGTWEEALAEGFRRLASFIVGHNAREQRIAMTAPVTAVRQGAGYSLGLAMPEGIDLPKPDDERIAVRALPSRRIAVLRFRGRYDEASIEARKSELMAKVTERGLVARGEPAFAGYDPPSTVPWLRRNEAWVEIEH